MCVHGLYRLNQLWRSPAVGFTLGPRTVTYASLKQKVSSGRDSSPSFTPSCKNPLKWSKNMALRPSWMCFPPPPSFGIFDWCLEVPLGWPGFFGLGVNGWRLRTHGWSTRTIWNWIKWIASQLFHQGANIQFTFNLLLCQCWFKAAFTGDYTNYFIKDTIYNLHLPFFSVNVSLKQHSTAHLFTITRSLVLQKGLRYFKLAYLNR